MRPISFADVPSLGLNLKDEGREKEGRRGKKAKENIFLVAVAAASTFSNLVGR